MLYVELLLFPLCVSALCLLPHCASPWTSHTSCLASVTLLHVLSRKSTGQFSLSCCAGVQNQRPTRARQVIFHRVKTSASHAGFDTAGRLLHGFLRGTGLLLETCYCGEDVVRTTYGAHLHSSIFSQLFLHSSSRNFLPHLSARVFGYFFLLSYGLFT